MINTDSYLFYLQQLNYTMPLFVDDTLLTSKNCTEDFILSHGKLRERSIEFISKKIKINIADGDRALYVAQREYATVSKQSQTLKIIGSGDATTCHILILVSPSALSIGHFDGSDTKNGLLNMINENEEVNYRGREKQTEGKLSIVAHIFGGFEDSRGLSRKLLEEMLHTMSLAEQDIHLQTACVYTLNTRVLNGLICPRIYGVCIDIHSNQIFQASFDNRGPVSILRKARIFVGCEEMISIYDSKSNMVQIGSFVPKEFKAASLILELDDRGILQNLSTSPHCEPSDFAINVRKTLQFLTEPSAIEDIFKNKKMLAFKINDEGDWVQQL